MDGDRWWLQQENWLRVSSLFIHMLWSCDRNTSTFSIWQLLSESQLSFSASAPLWRTIWWQPVKYISLQLVSTTHGPTTTLMTGFFSKHFLLVHLFRGGALPISHQLVRSFHLCVSAPPPTWRSFHQWITALLFSVYTLSLAEDLVSAFMFTAACFKHDMPQSRPELGG